MGNNKYAGIGSRNTPIPICEMMGNISTFLSSSHILYTGYAIGADQAFANKTSNRIIFNPNHKLNHIINSIDCTSLFNWELAVDIAKSHHPKWSKLTIHQQALITRNTYQILDLDLSSPVNFVVCWTADGAINKTSAVTGGTGQAIRIANNFNVPVFNLNNIEHYHYFEYVLLGIIDL